MSTYYVVGNPVPCTVKERGLGASDLYRVYRNAIPTKEIMDAFPKKEEIKLFLTWEDAQVYARTLQDGSDPEVIKYSPIYQITYNAALDGAPASEKFNNIEINYYTGKHEFIDIVEAELTIKELATDEYHQIFKPVSCNPESLANLYSIDDQNIAALKKVELRNSFFKYLAGATAIGLTAVAANYCYHNVDIGDYKP